MFLKNAWYAAAFAEDLTHALLPRTIVGERLVLWRRADGTPAALEDSCAHRRLPLSMGRLDGDRLQCAYHGIVYDGDGRCVRVPGEARVPDGAGVRAYPAVERWGFVWVWTGEAAAADPALIPDFSAAEAPGWLSANLHLKLKAFYQLHLDNLLDLSHIGFVHATTTGNAAVVEQGAVSTECAGETVYVRRRQHDIPPPAMFAEFGKFDGRVDMWQITEWKPPCYVRLNYGAVPTGKPVPAEPGLYWTNGDWGFRVFQCSTPETERTTHQFRCIKFDPRGASDRTIARFREQLDQVSFEDAPVLAAQQAALEADERASPADLLSTLATSSDIGPSHMRRIIAARLASQGHVAGPSPRVELRIG